MCTENKKSGIILRKFWKEEEYSYKKIKSHLVDLGYHNIKNGHNQIQKKAFSSNLIFVIESEKKCFTQWCVINFINIASYYVRFFIIIAFKFLAYIYTNKITSHSDISKMNFSCFQSWKGSLRKIMIRINGLSINSLAMIDRFEIDDSFYGNHFLVPVLLWSGSRIMVLKWKARGSDFSGHSF